MRINPIPESTDNDERIAQLQLALVPGIGAVLFSRLIEHAGSACAALRLDKRELEQVDGVGRGTANSIALAPRQVDPLQVIAECEREGISILLSGDEDYPSLLREISDPPPVLFGQGELSMAEEAGVAVVGTRHMSRYGERVTRRLVSELAGAGLTVVSGLARGIDRIAHEATLEQRGNTIAVIGSGHRHIYPSEHARLAAAIAAEGLILSEHPPHTPVKSVHFPRRNRVIAGISLGVVVIEAAEKSGALITARHATEQNRDVFAVPGPIDQRGSRGCHRLIRDGAKLVETATDVIEEFGPLPDAATDASIAQLSDARSLNLNPIEKQVWSETGPEEIAIDEIVMRTGVPVQRVLATLIVLESRGLIRRPSGSHVVRNH